MHLREVHKILDEQLHRYHTSDFIKDDPVCIPHRFTKRADIEISAFFAATLAWGNRKSIINSCTKLMQLMDNAPHEFVVKHQTKDLSRFNGFVHRTFLLDDLLYFIEWLQYWYNKHDSLEQAFVGTIDMEEQANVAPCLINFYNAFFSLPHLPRTHKHIATPLRNSACKRLNMFLRWMVREDKYGIDFNLWQHIKPHQLVIPLDTHVSAVAHQMALLPNRKSNWQNALLLTEKLKYLNPNDPVIYDYALFSIGVHA